MRYGLNSNITLLTQGGNLSIRDYSFILKIDNKSVKVVVCMMSSITLFGVTIPTLFVPIIAILLTIWTVVIKDLDSPIRNRKYADHPLYVVFFIVLVLVCSIASLLLVAIYPISAETLTFALTNHTLPLSTNNIDFITFSQFSLYAGTSIALIMGFLLDPVFQVRFLKQNSQLQKSYFKSLLQLMVKRVGNNLIRVATFSIGFYLMTLLFSRSILVQPSGYSTLILIFMTGAVGGEFLSNQVYQRLPWNRSQPHIQI